MAAVLLLASACAPSLRASDVADPKVAIQPLVQDPGREADYLIGQFALDQGDLRQANDALGRVLAGDPDNEQLRLQVFFLNVANGAEGNALVQAQTLIKSVRSLDEPRLALFIDSMQAGRLDAAGAELAALGDKGIGGLIAPVLQAWLDVARNKPGQALKVLPAAAADDPLYPVLVYHRAALEALSGKPAKGLSDLTPLLQQPQAVSARADLLAAQLTYRTKGPEAAKAFVADTLAHKEQSVVLGSVADELEAGKAPTSPLATAGQGVADILLTVSDVLRQQVSLERAIVYARLAQWAAPDDGEVNLTLAGLMLSNGNPDLASQIIRSVPKGSPWWLQAQLGQADALIAGNDVDGATRLLRQLSDERPQRIDALVKLGDLARQREDYAAAEAAYREAIQRVGEPGRRHWRLFYDLGVTEERQGKFENAVTDLKKALALEPNQPSVLNYLGYSWVDRGENLPEAMRMLQKAVELRPRDGSIIDSLGWAYFKVGRLEDAVATLEKAVEAEPGNAVINDHFGDALWKAGRTREARFQWQRTLSLSPDADVAKGVEDKLAHGLAS